MKKKSIIVMDLKRADDVYGPHQMDVIREMTDLIAQPMSKEQLLADPRLLQDVQVIFSGWGMCKVDQEFLAIAPELEAIFYGSGSVQGFATPELFQRGIVLTSSWRANAIPVAEFTFAQIILSLKKSRQFEAELRETRKWGKGTIADSLAGTYGSTVGLVSLGMVGRQTLEYVRHLDVTILAYDIGLTDETAAGLGVTAVPLPELFTQSDVVSLHTAFLPATRGMITGELIGSMKQHATLINTARGGLILEDEMIEVLRRRPDLTAVLDVVYPEPPDPESPLFDLPNVILTPHIAGCIRPECRRMGGYAVDECRRWLAGEPLHHQVTFEMLETMA